MNLNAHSVGIIGGADGPTAIFITYKLGVFYEWIALGAMVIFYAFYLGKMLLQRRRGIRTDQMGKNKAAGRRRTVEIALKIVTYLMIPAELLCILSGYSLLGRTARMAGAVLAILGDIIFALAIFTMKDSWRAGIAEKDRTDLITDGIYAWSRNPAFLGFDLLYLGILLMFFNFLLVFWTVLAIILLHLQILQEEAYLKETFGTAYVDYCRSTARYFGKKTRDDRLSGTGR